MKIGLIDVDGHSGFPNLALMKLSAYHKAQGDSVEFVNYFESYDVVYKSKVFTFTPDNTFCVKADKIICGGTGYKEYQTILPEAIEHICPDYSLYNSDYAMGFLTRGCIRKCSWCIVPKKEGNIKPNADIEEFISNKRYALLLDNNVLASDWGLSQIEKIIMLKIKVDFNQGLDARLISPEIADLLSRVKWIKRIRLACDRSEDIPVIERAYQMLQNAGYNKEIGCYLLIQDLRESNSRLDYLRQYKWFVPHAQPYRDFTGNTTIPQWQADMARWANRRETFKSCSFMDYQPRKGFKCSEYFKYETII